MKKLLFFLLLLPCLVKAQVTYFTPGVPPSSTSFSPTFRFLGADSLANFYINNSNRWSLFYTAAQSNIDFLRNQTHQSQPFNSWITGTMEIDNTSGTTALSLLNKTAATSSLNPTSPYFELGAKGWGGSSQDVDFFGNVVTSSGASNPTGAFTLWSQINGGSNTNVFQVTSSGGVTSIAFNFVRGILTGNNFATSGVGHALFSNGVIYQTADNDVMANVDLNGSAVTNSGLATVVVDNGGASYTNGTYPNTPLIESGIHFGSNQALGTVVISGGAVTSITPTTFGALYAVSDNITINASDVGGTGSGFAGHVGALHSYSGGKFLDLRVAGGVQLNGLASITATHGLGIDASGNIGSITLPTIVSANNGLIDSLGVIQLSDGSSGLIHKAIGITDANNTVSLSIIPANTGASIQLLANPFSSTNGSITVTQTTTSIQSVFPTSKFVSVATGSNGITFTDSKNSRSPIGANSYSTNDRKQRLAYAQVGTVIPLIDSVKATISGGATGANPTASAGTTAVNGSATTFMRSDAAPKIDSTQFATSALLSTYLPKASIVATYQPLLGFTPENVANKATTFGTLNNTLYPTTQAVANLGSVAATANDWVIRDGSGIGYFNNIGEAYTTTATTGGTITLTLASTRLQYFTGTANETVTLPVTSTLSQGLPYSLVSLGTGTSTITVKSSGGNTIGTIMAGSRATFTCILTSGTTAASWDFGEPVVQANNGLTNSGGIVQLGGNIPIISNVTLSSGAEFILNGLNNFFTVDNGGNEVQGQGGDGTNQAGLDLLASNGATLSYTNASGIQSFGLLGASGIAAHDYAGKGVVWDGLNDASIMAIPLAYTPFRLVDSLYARKSTAITTFTTTGASGAATYSTGTLNIPNYTLSGLGGLSSTATTLPSSFTASSLTSFGANPALGAATATSINKVAITAPPTSSTLTIANGATLQQTGAFVLNLTATAASTPTFPTGTSTLVGSVTTANGVSASNTAGALSFTLGAITPTTVNGNTISTGTGTLGLANSVSYTVDGIGQTTLVAGTKAVSITGVTTSSRAFVTLVSQGGTSTTVYDYKCVCTSGTITISAESVAGALVNTDTSTLNYVVYN